MYKTHQKGSSFIYKLQRLISDELTLDILELKLTKNNLEKAREELEILGKEIGKLMQDKNFENVKENKKEIFKRNKKVKSLKNKEEELTKKIFKKLKKFILNMRNIEDELDINRKYQYIFNENKYNLNIASVILFNQIYSEI